VERIVADLLKGQFEHTLAPRLFDPGRPVQVGETWRLDPGLARRFLRDQGIRVVQLGAPPTATLREVRDAQGGRRLAVDYRIPVSWVEPSRLPENGKLSDSEATFAGRIRLPAGPSARSREYVSRLELAMQGVIAPPGATVKVPWSLESSTISSQQTRIVEVDEEPEGGPPTHGRLGPEEAPPVASLLSRASEEPSSSTPPADRAVRP